MSKQTGPRPRNVDVDRPDEPPPGAALDRYEASMMYLIASRILAAYESRERPKPAKKA